ncbi:SET domain-containing protein SmydA-8-like isoform X2 [Coccinella septempunctata]|uniref:SET domain-containing protein SmydA-8-like isoform X2 n=1 Tax=Coccinella septempunctata TaxID=41139 RepID=UPI001D08B368|nr:SET domain-containing protein SmydA-8-like isoform X2 [Coccinella septempunctata]
MNQFCGVCKKSAIQSCSACNSIYYCGKEHQRYHWKHHKATCVPFKTVNDENGKVLIAIRNIEAGEKIITKLPLLTGPISEKDLICVSCFMKIDEKCAVECFSCGLKLCSESCNLQTGHKAFCEILKKSELKAEKCPNLLKFLIPLKILMLKSSDYKTFDSIVSNYVYQEPKQQLKNIVLELTRLCEQLGIACAAEELSKILVISKKNFIEIKDPKVENTKALYQAVPCLKQNCVPNTKNVFIGDANQLSIFATVPIKKGEVLKTNFAEPLWGTLERLTYLKATKYTECSCDRCKDPQELGAYVSSIYCQKCKDSLLEDISPKIISSNPIDTEAEWKCEKCENTIQAKQICFGNKSLTRELNGKNMKDPKGLEHFLFKYGEILHPTNSFSLRVKLRLVQLYGNSEGFKYKELYLFLWDACPPRPFFTIKQMRRWG